MNTMKGYKKLKCVKRKGNSRYKPVKRKGRKVYILRK